jgi:two-component system, chemotaxis family, response regulator WspF
MKIGIVNDVAMSAEVLRRAVVATKEHQIAWTAHSGADAVRLCAENRPDLILMDLTMPQMDGVETTRAIMRHTPCAILIVTTTPQENPDMVFNAMGAGALDVTSTQALTGGLTQDNDLLAKIRMIGKLIQADRNGRGRAPQNTESEGAAPSHCGVQTLIAIGASTGGPLALASILSDLMLPPTASIVIVQHIDRRFADNFVRWLAGQTALPVQGIEDGSRLVPGSVHVATTDDHLKLDERGRLYYSPMPRDYSYRPSVDIFFQCIADHWTKPAIGVLLTGMGRDGAEGLLAMRCAGKFTIAQDQASSAVYGMPRAAADLHAADMVLPLPAIATVLRDRLHTEENAAHRARRRVDALANDGTDNQTGPYGDRQ